MAKIVHFGKYYPPYLGGIENATAAAVKAAATAGHSVTVICFTKGESLTEGGSSLIKILRYKSIMNISSQPIGLRYFFQLIRFGWQADIIHLHAPNLLASFAAWFVGKKPMLLVHWHADVLGKGWLGRITSVITKRMLQRADKVICTSPPYAHGSANLRSVLEKIEIVPIGVRDPGLQSVVHAKNLANLMNERLSGKKVILSVGRLVFYKGFEHLIAATNYLDEDTKVVIVGDGPLHSKLASDIEAANLGDKIWLFGQASDEELDMFMRSADLFCLPSVDKAEAFGVAIIEAMSYGIPIVATNICGSGVPWVNVHGISGLNVPPENPAALATACRQILTNELDRKQFAQGARERYCEHFTQEAYISRINEVYRQLEGIIYNDDAGL